MLKLIANVTTLGCILVTTVFLLMARSQNDSSSPARAAPSTDGQMIVVAPHRVADGETFTVDLVIDAPPSGGYFGHQERLHIDGGLAYSPAPALADEVLAPSRCTLPLRVLYSPTDVLLACAMLPVPTTPFTDTGPVHRLTFTCHAPGGHLLLTTGDNLQSIFVGDRLQEIPMLIEAGAKVLCPASTSTPTVTPTPENTPTPTPTATSTPAPVDSDGDGCDDAHELVLGLDPANPRDWNDLDHSGTVDVADIAIAVGAFGTFDSVVDRTGDGVVSVGDIVKVVSQFGVSC